MSGMIRVFVPVRPSATATTGMTVSAAGRSLRGMTVGFIDNAKPNFHFLVDDLAAWLKESCGVHDVRRHRKSSASIPAEPETIAAFARDCDLVITGSGD